MSESQPKPVRIGRPPRAATTSARRICVPVTADEVALAHAAAREAGMTLAAYVRSRILPTETTKAA